ncbi:MAG: hypothetical protein LBV20_06670 [Treponema sp.]|jgi:hypothetical protein|nr:hypothetical protein [Treponema sp.]
MRINHFVKTNHLFHFGCLAVSLFITLMSCFSFWEGDASFSLYLGNPNQSGRMIIPGTDIDTDDLIHVIELDGPSGPEIIDVEKGSTKVDISVVPGLWTITVKAYLEDTTEEHLRYQGSATVDLKAGANDPISIEMIFEEQDPPEEPEVPEGSGNFYVNFDSITDGELSVSITSNGVSVEKLILSRSEGLFSATLKVDTADFDPNSIEWELYDRNSKEEEDSYPGSESNNPYRYGEFFVTLDSSSEAFYEPKLDVPGEHRVYLKVTIGGVPYSTEIIITVEE